MMKEPADKDLSEILGKPIDGLVPPPMVYVPDLGFRPASGLALRAPVTVTERGRTLTVDRLFSTSRATEVRCDLVGIKMPWQEAVERVSVVLRDAAGRSYAPGKWWFSNMAIEGGIRRVTSFETLPADLRRIELIATEGDVTISAWLALDPLESKGLAAHQIVDASAEVQGVTLRVRGVAFNDASTVIDLDAEAGGDIRYVRGIGALFGIRRGETKLTLRDDKGRVLTEVDPTVPPRDPMGRHDVAVFPAVAGDATALELRIDFVYAEEAEGEVEFAVPVEHARDLSFGRYPLRVLATRVVGPDSTLARSQDPRRDQSAIRIDLDLGTWHDDRRLLQPGSVLIDGSDHGFRWTPEADRGPTNAQQVSYVAIPLEEPIGKHTVTFRHPTVHIRGPWLMRFARP